MPVEMEWPYPFAGVLTLEVQIPTLPPSQTEQDVPVLVRALSCVSYPILPWAGTEIQD